MTGKLGVQFSRLTSRKVVVSPGALAGEAP